MHQNNLKWVCNNCGLPEFAPSVGADHAPCVNCGFSSFTLKDTRPDLLILIEDYKLQVRCAAFLNLSLNHFYRKMANQYYKFTDAEIEQIRAFIGAIIDDLYSRLNRK